ncbi:MAG TPA: type IV toxin-antitoxin system AbiEi family antitoxin [Tepidisphaeraceae bacterium]|nr:type IV toxin-antitoxin system AbiEi family antitoxin [Tepidisphaeraceae bacterium]
MNVNSLNFWIDHLQAGGRYSFTRGEAFNASGLSPDALSKSLQRLASKNRVAKVKENFYAIVPLEYLSAGAPPAVWFADELMRSMRLPYYVGLLSAAALHGASHHQPQEFQIVTAASQRALQVGRQRIRFFVRRGVAGTPVTHIKTPTGTVRVSTPEATALDLVRFAKESGYFDNIVTVLSELAERINPEELGRAAERNAAMPTVQRLGYLLDLAGAGAAAAPLAEIVRRRRPRTVSLRSDRPAKTDERNARWALLVNEHVGAEV